MNPQKPLLDQVFILRFWRETADASEQTRWRVLVRNINTRRRDVVDVAGLFFLTRSAPKNVQRNLMGAFGAQCVIGIASAALRPYTSSAFGVLVPVVGLGLAGLWAARRGTFPARPSPQ